MIQFLIRRSCLWLALLGALVPWRLALAQAEPTLSVKRGAVAAYDRSREITVQGTIEEVENARSGAPLSTHLKVRAQQGLVDVDLGPAATASKLTYTPGQAVQVVGVMADASGGPVLLARIVESGNQVTVLRNEHGLPLRARGPRGAAILPQGSR